MHDDWDADDGACSECRGHYVPGHICWKCKGSGVEDEDDGEYRPPPFVSRTYIECPRCSNLMARPGEAGEIWCNRCDRYFRPFDEGAVVEDPGILEMPGDGPDDGST